MAEAWVRITPISCQLGVPVMVINRWLDSGNMVFARLVGEHQVAWYLMHIDSNCPSTLPVHVKLHSSTQILQ
jgi:hypothetical protein